MAKKQEREKHVSLSVRNRQVFTAIKKGRRFIYYPTTPYYLRRLCDIVDDYYEVRDIETIELRGRTGRYVFKVEDIYIKAAAGGARFKIYLGDVIEFENIKES